MRLSRIIVATVFAILIAVVQVSPAAAHGGETAFARAADILTATLSVMVALIIVFVLWVSGQAKLRPVHYYIIGLGVTTALIHLLEGLYAAPWLFLNGLGYVGLLAALYLPLDVFAGFRDQIRWTLIGYTLLTIITFFVVHPWGFYQGQVEWLGVETKVVELFLIGLLLLDQRSLRSLAT